MSVDFVSGSPDERRLGGLWVWPGGLAPPTQFDIGGSETRGGVDQEGELAGGERGSTGLPTGWLCCWLLL